MKKIILVSLASTLLLNTVQASAMASDMTMKEPSNVMINYNPGLLFVNFKDENFMKGPVIVKNSNGEVIADNMLTMKKNIIKIPRHQSGAINIQFGEHDISYRIPIAIGSGRNG
ncbi:MULTISPECIES: hypothetical protein [Aeromonas]|uniref:hypothetical protein n=1 Tax=Aeromonas TaxID=642 RepID=UPI000F5F69F3|nr:MULTISPECIES: hypothetical protein [Aeromonas]MBW3730969.1 hypothetical protein [Aeromonas dhakensis]MCJ8218266.1 hypothetical protein [Aeromonas veronii]NJI25559.1 hypothetical protein [Aeromonas veronii]NJI36235.1 hypothetical protein [Aeromonas veronii]QSR55621.1 hypothetical protein GO601_09430 [Aeromonas dhakensis]